MQRLMCYRPIQLDFDGGVFDLVNDKGQLLRKQWRVWTNLPALVEPLSQKFCFGGHGHAMVHGKAAAYSAYYTEKLVDDVGSAVLAWDPGASSKMVVPFEEARARSNGIVFWRLCSRAWDS